MIILNSAAHLQLFFLPILGIPNSCKSTILAFTFPLGKNTKLLDCDNENNNNHVDIHNGTITMKICLNYTLICGINSIIWLYENSFSFSYQFVYLIVFMFLLEFHMKRAPDVKDVAILLASSPFKYVIALIYLLFSSFSNPFDKCQIMMQWHSPSRLVTHTLVAQEGDIV